MTSAASPQQSIIRFAVFELDAEGGELRKCGMKVHLRPQAAHVLVSLARRPGQVVTREELKHEIWGSERFVDFEHGLNLCIRQIRAALNDDADTPRYIETLPRRGYRFIASVQEVAAERGVAVMPSNGAPVTVSGPQDNRHEPYNTARRRQVWTIRLWVAAAFLLAIAAVFFASTLLRERASSKAETLRIASIAVLPLENLSQDPEQEYFADGMTDELITDLAKIHSLRVISRNSVMQYKGKHKPVPQIGRELNVDAVIEGTVVHAGDRVRITAQLIDARQDRHLWADTYEGDLRNVLALQDEVTTAIANQISIELTPQEQTEFATARSVNPEAHQAYLRGLYELGPHYGESNTKAIDHFKRAITIDPSDSLAYAGLAVAYTSSDEAPKIAMPKAKAAALKAIELDDTLAEAHSSLGFIKLVFDWDWPGAEQELRRALQLNPNSPLAHMHYGRYLLLIPHRVDEAIKSCQRAYDLDPAVPAELDDLVGMLFFARRYTAAINEAAKELEDNSPFLGMAYAELGRRDEALAVAARVEASARNPTLLAQTASAYALAGGKRRAYALLEKIQAQSNQQYVCGMNVASVYSTLGDKDQAMAWLEKAYRDRSV